VIRKQSALLCALYQLLVAKRAACDLSASFRLLSATFRRAKEKPPRCEQRGGFPAMLGDAM
jgi:hypothetical protein